LQFFIPLFFLFTYIIAWFQANRSSEFVTTIVGDIYLQVIYFSKLTGSLGTFLQGFRDLASFSLGSLIYHILVIRKEQRKSLTSFKHSELVVNTR
tara:strand:+ start:128 stop:412 length:285 start_codon:yes stop_codon:yes gene_type:complete